MRQFRHFFIPSVIFFLCSIFILNALAQEKLPEIVKKIEPSTLVILTYDKNGKMIGQGSGFFISQSGDIITNRHVLTGVHRAEVKTARGKVYPITLIVAEDKEADIIRASVNNPSESIRPLSVSISIPEVGERVAVIGNPLGLERTVSDGIVSAVRKIPAFGNIYQITAPISPGSSGSPVVNMKGEVIGIATFQSIEGQNLNFAIPGERIARLKTEKGKTFNQWKMGQTDEWLASAEWLYHAGVNFLGAEDYEKALPYFEKAAEKDPGYANAYFQIGYCNGNLGRHTEAIEAFKQAIRIKPDYAEAHYNLGVAYSELGRHTEAIEAYKQAIRIKPDNAEAHCNLGVAYGNLGRHTEAIEAFKQAIRIKPDIKPEAYCNMGVYYSELGRHTEAIEAFKQAIRIKPDYAEAHYYLGVAYGRLGQFREEIEAYKHAIRIKPDFAEALSNLGAAYCQVGRYREAIDYSKQAIRIKPDAMPYLNLGSAYSRLKSYAEAIEAYKQAIRIKPDFAEAHDGLGLVYSQMKRFTEAMEAFKQAIRIKPNYAEAHYSLGITYLLLGNKGSALDQYKILKNLDSDLANELFNLIYKN